VLMAQLPPDSQRATWSHSLSLAGLAWPASATPLPPRTALVNASLATVTADVVDLRCRPLMIGCCPLCSGAAARVQAMALGRGGEDIASAVTAFAPLEGA
jgi:hypothetical protein